jgi:hypothetical protein
MADTQPAPQPTAEPLPELPGSVREAQEALLGLMEPEEEKPQEEEAQPTEEEESTEETQDESLEEESEEEESEEEESDDDTDERELEGDDLLYAVNINGEEHQIPLDELVKGYSRQSDYTRKTQELSEQRRSMEANQVQWGAEIQQIQAERQQYVNALQNVIENSMGSLDQFATVDWDTLKNDNPLEYITKRDEYREMQDKVRQAQFQQQQAQQAYQQESQKNHHRVLQEEHGKLVEALPEWSEQKARQKLSGEIKEYALSQGYTTEEISSLIDHRSLMTIYKAMKYDKASSPSVVNKKVKNKPRVIRAGSPRTKSDTDKGKRNLQMKRLQESGHVRDASALFEDFVEL